MKKRTWIILIGIVVAAGILIWYIKFRDNGTMIVLKTDYPSTGTLSSSVTATGTIQPVDTVAVGTQVSVLLKMYMQTSTLL